MKPGWFWIMLLALTYSLAQCEVKHDYPEEKYGIRPVIAKIWCGSPTCLDKLKE